MPFYYYLDNAYALSTSVGSGKTHAAIEYMLGGSLCRHNFIYVAPTIALVNQTTQALKTAIESHQGHTRNVNLVHSETDLGVSPFEAALECINGTEGNMGAVVVLTTQTFLRVLHQIRNRAQWRVLLDEAFSPLNFLYHKLGKDRDAGRSYFAELFEVDAETSEVLPGSGKSELVRAVALGDEESAGTKFSAPTIKAVAQAVTNPAIRCELVEGPQNWMTVATYVTPEYFAGFREVVFMAALFDHSILFHLWERNFGVDFQTHPYFDHRVQRNVHVSQGPLVAVGHVLHQNDHASRYNLQRHRKTGKANEVVFGNRIIDHAVQSVSAFFQGQDWLLQVNNWTGYEKRKDKLPKGAKLIKVHSHGLNHYQDYTNVAALAVTNPDKWEARWIMAKTGLNEQEMYQAYRIHTCYQAVGRSAIRNSEDTRPKVFIVTGYSDALFLHQLFEGSTWLGKIGDVRSLRELTAKNREKNRKPTLRDHPDYSRLRDRKKYLQRKVRNETISETEAKELEALIKEINGLKKVSWGCTGQVYPV